MRPLEDVWAPHRETLWGAVSGAGLKVLTGQGAAIDTTTPAGKLVFAIFAALAEFDQTLAHVRTLGRHAQRIVERVALGTKLYQGLAPDVANQTLRALRDAGIVEHHGHGEWRIFDPLLRRYLQQLPGEARRA